MTPYQLTAVTEGIRAVPSSDPTGGGLQSHRIQIQREDGSWAETQLHLILHNTAGWKAYTGNSADADVIEVDPANGRIVVQTP